MITIQKGTWPGWPDGVTVELEDHAAAAVLTAARDYQAESGRNLHGDYLALPAGGLRLPAWVTEMQWGFDHRHDTGANKTRSNAIYAKYNMDRSSNARPAMNTHTLGICADVADNGWLAWLQTNKRSEKYGLRFTLLALHDNRHMQFIPGLATVALNVAGLNNTEDMDMITRRLVRQTNTPGVYYAVNNVLSPVISEAHLASIIADMHGLAAAGDPFLVQAGPAAFGTSEVADLRLAGIVPATAADVGETAWDPTPAELAKISAAITGSVTTAVTALAAQVTALDKQADDYQARLEAILTKGLTISGTASPAK